MNGQAKRSYGPTMSRNPHEKRRLLHAHFLDHIPNRTINSRPNKKQSQKPTPINHKQNFGTKLSDRREVNKKGRKKIWTWTRTWAKNEYLLRGSRTRTLLLLPLRFSFQSSAKPKASSGQERREGSASVRSGNPSSFGLGLSMRERGNLWTTKAGDIVHLHWIKRVSIRDMSSAPIICACVRP